MLKRLMIALILQILFGSIVVSAISEKSHKINQVIFITLDGVRWQDVYLERGHFPLFWKKYASNTAFYGAPQGSFTMHTASIPVSLPSYQSQMAGTVQPCGDNFCGRIGVETLPEKIVRSMHLPKKQVATFSSWAEISDAVEHTPGATFSNTGNEPVYDPESLQPDPVMANLNQKQSNDHPQGHDRYDRYTFSQAWHYFLTYNPRFIWIALNDADEAAHAGDLQRYNKVLSYYDEVLDVLLSHLKEHRKDKETLVIVTTDHGRANGTNWTKHAKEYPESRQIWSFVINGELLSSPEIGKTGHYDLLSIRPTVERALNCVSN